MFNNGWAANMRPIGTLIKRNKVGKFSDLSAFILTVKLRPTVFKVDSHVAAAEVAQKWF